MNRFNNLNFIRWSLAVLVVFSHSFGFANRGKCNDWLWIASHDQATLGRAAVDAFFIISGYLILQSRASGISFGQFWFRRAGRIYPGFLVGIVAGSIAYATLPPTHAMQWQSCWPVALISLPTLRTTGMPVANVALWTLQYEGLCYVLLALLWSTGFYRSRSRVALFTLMQFVIFCYMDTRFGYQVDAPYSLARYSFCFSIGSAIYLWRREIPFKKNLAWSAMGLLLAASLSGQFRVLSPVAFGYLIYYFGLKAKPVLKNFGKRTDLTYGTYVCGWPVQAFMMHFNESWRNPYLIFAVSISITTALAYLSWHFVEKHFVKRRTEGHSESGRHVAPLPDSYSAAHGLSSAGDRRA